MHFILLVEGKTEGKSIAKFLKRWLDPQLSEHIGIKTVNLKGFGEFKKEASRKAKKHLEGPDKNEIIAVIGLLDLYGPSFYPTKMTTVEERYKWAVDYFKKEVNHPKFRMFMAVHEFEAWLFSQPRILPFSVSKNLECDWSQPETINFDEPPGKLLNKLYLRNVRRGYKKSVNGPELFEHLDPAVAYEKCPYLKVMLDEMSNLAGKAGL